jgi:urease accessory protein
MAMIAITAMRMMTTTTIMVITMITATIMARWTSSDASPAIRTMAITMTDQPAALLRLMSWLSPTFPVGAFAYSHGVEQAIHDGQIRDRETLRAWLAALLERGSAWNDAVLLSEAWRRTSASEDCAEVSELAAAMAGSRERHMETSLQGEAFGDAVSAWKDAIEASAGEGSSTPYPIAVAVASAQHAIPLSGALSAYLHAFTSNLIQSALRLAPLGQKDGVATIAALEPVMSDIASMKHETLYSRVFRS